MLENEEVFGQVGVELEHVDQDFRSQGPVDDIRLVCQKVGEAVDGQQNKTPVLDILELLRVCVV